MFPLEPAEKVTTEIPSKPQTPNHYHVSAFPWQGPAEKPDLRASRGPANSAWVVSEEGWAGRSLLPAEGT